MRLKRLQSELERVAVFEEPRIEWEQYPTPPHLAAQIVQLADRYGDVDGKAVGDLGVGCGILTIAAALMGSCYNVAYDIDEAATTIARRNFAAFDCVVDVVHVDVASMRRWTADDVGEAEAEEMEDNVAPTRRGKSSRASAAPASRKSARGRGGGRGRPRPSSRPTAAPQPSSSDSDEEGSGDDNDGHKAGRLHPPPHAAAPLQPVSPPPPSSSPLPMLHPLPPPRVLDTVVLNPPFGTRQSGVDVTFLHVALQLSRHAVYSLHKTSTRAFFQRLCERWGLVGEVVAEMRFELKRSYAFHREKSKDVEVDLWRFTFHAALDRPERFGGGRPHNPLPPAVT